MKKIIAFLILLLCVKQSYAQYPLKQFLGSDSTLVTVRGGMNARVVLWSFTDTTQANTQRISQYAGALIYTTVLDKVWYRNSTATGWIEFTSSGGTTTNIYNSDGFITGTRVLDLSASPLTFSRSGVKQFAAEDNLTTIGSPNNQKRITVYNDSITILGLSQTTDTTTYKPLAIDGNGYFTIMDRWPGGGGSTPTLQQVLTAGSTLTGNNTITGGLYSFKFTNQNLWSVDTARQWRLRSFREADSSMQLIQSSNYGVSGLKRINISSQDTAYLSNIIIDNDHLTNEVYERNPLTLKTAFIQAYNRFSFQGDTGIMVIEANNRKVGIITDVPDSTLHVVGGLKFVTGRQGAGKVLTSDANGGADWATPSGGTYTFTNGLSESGGTVKLGGTLTETTTINTNTNELAIQSNSSGDRGTIFFNGAGQVEFSASSNVDNSTIRVVIDSLQFEPKAGRMNIDTLAAASNMTNKKVMTWDEVTKRWEQISPDSVGKKFGVEDVTASADRAFNLNNNKLDLDSGSFHIKAKVTSPRSDDIFSVGIGATKTLYVTQTGQTYATELYAGSGSFYTLGGLIGINNTVFRLNGTTTFNSFQKKFEFIKEYPALTDSVGFEVKNDTSGISTLADTWANTYRIMSLKYRSGVDNSLIERFDFRGNGDLNITGTGATKFQSGNTSQRPSSPTTGMMRYNTDSTSFEYYTGSAWLKFGTASGGASDGYVDNATFNTTTNYLTIEQTGAADVSVRIPPSYIINPINADSLTRIVNDSTLMVKAVVIADTDPVEVTTVRNDSLNTHTIAIRQTFLDSIRNGDFGGGSPGGSDTYVQFNDGGVFGGDAGFNYNKTDNELKINTSTDNGAYKLQGEGGMYWKLDGTNAFKIVNSSGSDRVTVNASSGNLDAYTFSSQNFSTSTGGNSTFTGSFMRQQSGAYFQGWQQAFSMIRTYPGTGSSPQSTVIFDNTTETSPASDYQIATFKLSGTSVAFVDKDGKYNAQSTVTAGGTTGNQTINKPTGTVNIAAAGSTVTVTNSTCNANSIVYAVLRTNDATATGIKSVVPSAGSFVITLNAAATAEVSVGFIVFN